MEYLKTIKKFWFILFVICGTFVGVVVLSYGGQQILINTDYDSDEIKSYDTLSCDGLDKMEQDFLEPFFLDWGSDKILKNIYEQKQRLGCQ